MKKIYKKRLPNAKDQRNPNANTCIKLAAFYTIRREMFGAGDNSYSLAPNPQSMPVASEPESEIYYHGDSDFAKAIYEKDPDAMWAIMDELMTALQVVNPRLYDSVMRKIAE